ncbi:hypothetical protein IPA_07775 [Ignicoccus pacificus DSM 13166]|uniref:THUMP domain-containing protein n=1 Tax=Ignicoccus pacificus DSM 13166 TaxID=940294 RepID=A0A977KBP0_9CREN|nr:hypothetical protein IPA_07775 [Ignicoccus pacificus DSM 13166]
MEEARVRPSAVTLVAYSEIAVKGRKRSLMENLLKEQIRKKLFWWGVRSRVFMEQGRIVITGKAPENLRRVPGVHHLAYAWRLPKLPPEELAQAISFIIREADQFAVRVRRADKRYPMRSNELAALIGSKIEGEANLSSPKLVIYVEIRNDVYLYTSNDILEGVGGLPYGVEGRAYVLGEGEELLLMAALMARRGVEVVLSRYEEGVGNLVEALPKPLRISKERFCPIVSSSKTECPTIIPTRPCVPKKTLEKAKLLLNREVEWEICGEGR